MLALVACLTVSVAAAEPAPPVVSDLVVVDDVSGQTSPDLEEPGDLEEPKTRPARSLVSSPPSRGGAFAGAYMAGTAVGATWVAGTLLTYGMLALSTVAPWLAPIALTGWCVNFSLVGCMPLAQGIAMASMGNAVGGYDAIFASLLAVASAFASALFIGGTLLWASVIAAALLVPSLGYAVEPAPGLGQRQISTIPFAVNLGTALVLALITLVLQPLIPAAVFALTVTDPSPKVIRNERNKTRGPFYEEDEDWDSDSDSDSGSDSDDDDDDDDDDDEAFEVRLPVRRPSVVMVY